MRTTAGFEYMANRCPSLTCWALAVNSVAADKAASSITRVRMEYLRMANLLLNDVQLDNNGISGRADYSTDWFADYTTVSKIVTAGFSLLQDIFCDGRRRFGKAGRL